MLKKKQTQCIYQWSLPRLNNTHHYSNNIWPWLYIIHSIWIIHIDRDGLVVTNMDIVYASFKEQHFEKGVPLIIKTKIHLQKCTVKPVLNGHTQIDKTKILKTNGSIMKVKSIAECSPWSILQYF